MQYPTMSEYVKASQDAGDNLDMSTEATNAELDEAIMDEFGAKYSQDGRKLLKAPKELDGTYSIRKETKIICDWTFDGCKSLRNIVIPDSVTSIGYSAFSGCKSLECLVLPKSVGNIIGNPFSGWYGELKCLSPNFIFEDGVLYDKDKSTIISFRDQDTTSYVISAGVTSIADGAFEGCSSLSSIVIPNGVTRIGDVAFQYCSSLIDIIIPDSVTSIGEMAFRCCNIPTDLKQELSSRFGKGIFEQLHYALYYYCE
jgi:hypothetical protein